MQQETQQAEELPQCLMQGSFVEIGGAVTSQKYRFQLAGKRNSG